MSYLFTALLGITVTQPALVDQAGDSSWTAPGYRVVEEVSINPLDYGEPIGWSGGQAEIACQMFFVPADDGEKWRVVMVFKNKVVVLQEDEEMSEIPLYCTPYGAIFSRGGRYVLVLGSAENQWYDELINTDTGDVQPYLFRDETGWSGYIYVCDNGSTVRSSYGDMFRNDPGRIEIIDPELKLVGSWVDTTSGVSEDTGMPAHFNNYVRVRVSSDGSLVVMSFMNRSTMEFKTIAFDGDGREIWENKELAGLLHVTSDGSYVIFHDSSGLRFVDGRTGEVINSYGITDRINATTCSRTGQSWAFQLYGMRGHFRDEQRYDGRRGLIWGTNPSQDDKVNVLTYVSNNWDHINPYRVSESGAVLGISTARPSSGHNHDIWRFVYITDLGNITWISPPVNLNIEQSQHEIAAYNFNNEHELGSIPSALQSDGQRFGFYDGKTLKYFRIEGSDM